MSNGQTTSVIIEKAVLELLNERGVGKSICPSEVARILGGDGWRHLMESVRAAGVRLALANQIEITQKGEVVDPLDFRGPVRFRLKGPSETPTNRP
ncbi:MAG: DUF3253 domain-containing protein [Verrucomicrobia bacterium]|jgi:hypothetical protein|nr:DUF3253 domain-containing protein [Verrucomicrobiota bacterium]